ncbi:MAG TPA: hypothetical protein VG013_33150 [Gemmataceae bacterium]|jgi:ABC-2 type transport system permease protein|nr:hypothetical protein [Gemmataceae bacterium]
MNDTLAPVRVNQPLLFQQLRWRLLHNAVAALRRGASARLITIGLCSLLVWSCVFAASWLGFDFLRLQNRYNTFLVVEDMIATFFDLFFLALALGLVFSGSIILYSSLFSSAETTFLLSTPAAADQVFAYKFHGAVAFSSWAFVLLGSPVLVAYGLIFEVPWYFYALLPFFFVGFVLLPGSVGALICLLVVNTVPRRRKQVLVLVLVVLCLRFVYWTAHLIHAAQGQSWTRDAVKDFLSQFDFAQGALTPSHWMTQGLLAARHGNLGEAAYRLALVWSNGLFLYVATAWVAARLYRRGYNRIVSGGTLRRRYGGAWLDRLVSGVVGFLDPQTRLLIIKDFRTFRRDPAQWAQVLIFTGLMVLYFANVRRFYQGDINQQYKNGVSLINLAATAMLLCAYTGRFIYPMLSLEGRKFWILGLLPMRRERLLWGKFAFAATWALLIAEFLVVFSDLMLGMDAPIIGIHALTVLVLAVGLSGLSVGLGAWMPNFRETDPSKIAVGFGGTLNLVAGLLYILVILALMALPWHVRAILSDALGRPIAADWVWYAALAAGLAVGAAAVFLPLRLGARNLRRMEF